MFLLIMLCCLLAGGTAASVQNVPPSPSNTGGPIRTLQLDDGVSVRYLKVGHGRPLILLHTIRTQLEYFDSLIPKLKDHYEIYALDLPGHGQSSLPAIEYTEPLLRRWVMQFIERLGLRDVTLAGESIGGVLALTVAAELPDRVARVVSLNPYDYGERFGGGIRRSANGWIISLFDLFGCRTVETRFALAAVLRGGFYDPSKLPDDLLGEFDRSGERPGFRCAESSVFANWHSWIEARPLYVRIKVPVTLVYGDHDWSKPPERSANQKLLRRAKLIVLESTGHFSALENPAAIANLIVGNPLAECCHETR
jgi:pimeloyl-ACP methyl ester carboxylesterase